MLIGQYEHTIDSKKRLALPVKFRGELGDKLIITRGIENCLVVYTEKEWRVISEKLSNLPISQT
ncbi:MAG: cell division/cell wall cluster transcriptional repressor MraZ, partial [Candidatus Nealsonbacteria bacterium CG08_land_8_20_14_0_20_36_22]